jgi:protein involved in polysaccharide export with SLBB domain
LWISVLLIPLIGIPTFGAQSSATQTTYLIHSGDQLNVQVYGEQTLTETVAVLADGSIDYPLIGRIVVGDKTPDQAAATIRTQLL